MQRQKAVRDGPMKYEVHRVVTGQFLLRGKEVEESIQFGFVYFIRWKQHEKERMKIKKKVYRSASKRFSLIVNRDTGQVCVVSDS